MNSLMDDSQFAHEILKALVALGVSHFSACAGARNLVFLRLLEQEPSERLHVYSFFDERSASFFSLGQSANTHLPSCVLTTSGTAVAEVLPAVIEAFYQGLPLVVLSCDRPKNHRGRGTPQAIDQTELLKSHVEVVIDVEVSETGLKIFQQGLASWSRQRPLQINVCLGEPSKSFSDEKFPSLASFTSLASSGALELEISPRREGPLHTTVVETPLVLVGPLSKKDSDRVASFLLQNQLLFFAEPLSQLRNRKDLQALFLRNLDDVGMSWLRKKYFSSVLRIGGVPTGRFWRDLDAAEEVISPIPVYVCGRNAWPGLTRQVQCLDFHELAQLRIRSNLSVTQNLELKNFENTATSKPLSPEENFAKSLIEHFETTGQKKHFKVYLGNSLTVRSFERTAYFDFIDSSQVDIEWYGSRGVNGIDGQISTFLGWVGGSRCRQSTFQQGELHPSAHPYSEAWCIVGDLTALYDLQALWITNQLDFSSCALRIVIVNNHGGQIFQPWGNKLAMNSHDLSFELWAKMFGWPYRLFESSKDLKDLPTHVVIEAKLNS